MGTLIPSRIRSLTLLAAVEFRTKKDKDRTRQNIIEEMKCLHKELSRPGETEHIR